MRDEKQVTLRLLHRMVQAQPNATIEQIGSVLAMYSDAVEKELSGQVPRVRSGVRRVRRMVHGT